MADGASADVWLGDLIHEYGGHDAAGHVMALNGILQGNGIDDGGEHAHVVGADAVHFAGLLGHAAKEITAAYDDADLHAQSTDLNDLAGDLCNAVGVEPETARPCQCFAR